MNEDKNRTYVRNKYKNLNKRLNNKNELLHSTGHVFMKQNKIYSLKAEILTSVLIMQKDRFDLKQNKNASFYWQFVLKTTGNFAQELTGFVYNAGHYLPMKNAIVYM